MADNTRFDLQILSRIELPPKMTKVFVDKLKEKHPEPLAIKDSATYEYVMQTDSKSFDLKGDK